MNLLRILLLALLPFCGATAPGCLNREGGPVNLTVMTFNVLCSFCTTPEHDPWDERLAYFSDIIGRYDPDLIGFQEFFTDLEVEQVAAAHPGYGYLFFTDPGGPILKYYPDATIFYKRARFEVLQSGTYWLSETPEIPWTYGWASSQLWRLVTWAHLRHKANGREFYFATTHVDNNTPNQEKSAPIILDYTRPWAARMPALVVGDFNSKPSREAYHILTRGLNGQGFKLQNSFDLAERWQAAHNKTPAPGYDTDSRIDHIFVAGPTQWSCTNWWADLHVYGNNRRYPSDHFPIIAELSFK